jgi:ABC-type transporter Mla MlaB component
MSTAVASIDGPLTFATLAPHLRELDQARGENLDLARCTRIDSAGAAYLLERSRRARAKGLHLRVINANQQVRNLLHFFELDEVVAVS